jgi:hypothetical protein
MARHKETERNNSGKYDPTGNCENGDETAKGTCDFSVTVEVKFNRVPKHINFPEHFNACFWLMSSNKLVSINIMILKFSIQFFHLF